MYKDHTQYSRFYREKRTTNLSQINRLHDPRYFIDKCDGPRNMVQNLDISDLHSQKQIHDGISMGQHSESNKWKKTCTAKIEEITRTGKMQRTCSHGMGIFSRSL